MKKQSKFRDTCAIYRSVHNLLESSIVSNLSGITLKQLLLELEERLLTALKHSNNKRGARHVTPAGGTTA